MGQIEDLRLFVQILEAGSISRAAVNLNIAKSAVSRRLALLEERYDATLIERSPGNWRVTETGTELHQRALRVIEEVNEIDVDFVSGSADLSGPLSISVPRDFGLGYLKHALTDFKIRYPEIALSVDFDDRVVDLSQENYDFAIRITDSTGAINSASRIGVVEHALYASSTYFKTRTEPRCLEDLHAHQLLNYGRVRKARWDFIQEKKKTLQFNFKPFLNSNSGLYLLNATLRGLGISRLPDFIVKNAIDDKSLVRVLPNIESPRWGIYLLHEDNRHLNRRMRVFIEEIKQACESITCE